MRHMKITLIVALVALAFLLAPRTWSVSYAQDGWNVWFASTATSGSMTTTSAIVNANAFDTHTDIIRIVADQAFFFAFGPTDGTTDERRPFASNTTGVFVPANAPEYFWIGGGGFLAVRASDTSGMVYIVEMTR